MKSLIEFSDVESYVYSDNILTESLNNPVEFYLTDDTKIPQNVTCAFKLDGVDYGASLEQSNFSKVYMMRVYRIVNEKRRYWSFKKTAHIKPIFATVLKFAESSIPFLKSYMDGILVVLPGKMASPRFNRFAKLILRRTYINSFRSVEVQQDGKNSYNYIFFVRKIVNPKSLFKGSHFKSYTFDDDGSLPIEAADDMEPKKKSKFSATLNPSTKYSFKGFELSVDNVPDIEEIINVKPAPKNNDIEKEKLNKEKEELVKKKNDLDKKIKDLGAAAYAQKNKDYEKQKKEFLAKKPKGETVDNILDNSTPAYVTGVILSKGADIVLDKGFDPDKLNYSNMEYVIQSEPPAVKDWLNKMDFTLNGHLTEKGKKFFTDGLKVIGNIKDPTAKSGYKAVRNKLVSRVVTATTTSDYTAIPSYEPTPEYNALMADYSKTSDQSIHVSAEIKKINSKLNDKLKIEQGTFDHSKLVATLPGSGTIVTSFDQSYTGFYEKDGSTAKKENHIWDTIGHKVQDQLTGGQFQALKSYTSSSYDSYNYRFRKPFKNIGSKNFKLEKTKAVFNDSDIYTESATKLYRAFQKIDPTDWDMWVFRGSSTKYGETNFSEMKPGDDYVDPGFISTTLDHDMTYGYYNLRFKIFVPKGSRVMPALKSNSNNSSEREIILPPMSVLKILEVVYFEESDKYAVTAMFMGSAMPAIEEEFQKLTGEPFFDPQLMKERRYFMMDESKKKYDPNKKYAGQSPNPQASKYLAKKFYDRLAKQKAKLDKKK